jgi:hypothetical protein
LVLFSLLFLSKTINRYIRLLFIVSSIIQLCYLISIFI